MNRSDGGSVKTRRIQQLCTMADGGEIEPTSLQQAILASSNKSPVISLSDDLRCV